jgi:hypothetical protein
MDGSAESIMALSLAARYAEAFVAAPLPACRVGEVRSR